ncbi:MAG: ribonuclease J [Proteobacteria bacterium]|nr:ribonuclease J [Pseudomonadota bacterium]
MMPRPKNSRGNARKTTRQNAPRTAPQNVKWKPDDLLFVPLGGTADIGMNVNLYHYQDQWLMVDCGIGFPANDMHGIDVLLPDLNFIKDKQDKLQGLVLTHGHEDHFGAIPYLWRSLGGCPIYGSPFTIALLGIKLKEAMPDEKVDLRVLDYNTAHDIGVFNIELLPITHSIPDSGGLVVRAGGQTIYHSGDWKFDPAPQLAPTTDMDALKRVGKDGVLALIGDSTNALTDALSGSEEDARLGLIEAIKKENNRVAVTCFASNVARLNSLVHAAVACGRTPMLVGRALLRMRMAAEACGYIDDWPDIADADDFDMIPRNNILLICTGSQGEARSAMTRIANRTHPQVTLDAGDSVLFSSREIPGNEEAIARVQSQLLMAGVKVITADDAPIHVSGHPSKHDMIAMYDMLRPKVSIPVHGTPRHLMAHSDLAKQCQVPKVHTPEDGQIIRLHPGEVEVIGTTDTRLKTFDGGAVVDADSEGVKNRRRMLWNGAIAISIVVSEEGGLCGEPSISQSGIVPDDDDGDFLADATLAIEDGLAHMRRSQILEDREITRMTKQALARLVKKQFSKRPTMFVHVTRVAALDVNP